MEFHVFQAQLLLCRKAPVSFRLKQFLQSFGNWPGFPSTKFLSQLSPLSCIVRHKQLQMK